MEDEADLAAPDGCACVFAQLCDGPSIQSIFAAVRPFQKAQKVHQGRLPRARAAADRNKLAALDRERHVGYCANDGPSGRIVFRNSRGPDQRRHLKIPDERRNSPLWFCELATPTITCWPSVSGPSSSAAPLSSLAPSFTATGCGCPSLPTTHTVAEALEAAASGPARWKRQRHCLAGSAAPDWEF